MKASRLVRPAAKAAVAYVRDNPDELVRVATNALTLRFGVPLAALRWAVEQLPAGRRTPKDIELGTAPPALRLAATVDAMGTPLRASAAIRIESLEANPRELRIAVRLSEVKLVLIGESDAPIAALIKSGALDLSKPGNLVKFLPNRPPFIVEAENDRILVDLMRVPKLAANERLRRALAVVSPVLGVRAVETDRDHFWIAFRTTPRGLGETVAALRSL
jgi:hypothetical protein